MASALDIGALIHDLSDGDKANLFTADLFVPSVRLNPATSAIFSGAEVTFSASVPGVSGVALVYAWNLSGDNLAILTDSKTGKSGNTFETPGNVVTLTTSPSSQKKLTVTVEAFLPQTDGSRKSLGTASGIVTIDDQPKVLPGTFKVDIKVNGDRAGATALVTFSPVPGAKTYTLKGTGGTDPTYGPTFERSATAPVQATLGDGSVLDNVFGLSSAGGPADRDYTGAYNARFGAYTFTVTASR